ncbi:DUF692 domain-containing protein [Alteromonas ponticola]|uniref:UPF0276 protein OPS25_07690 n=1 Tax=Alteromonas aquimaris TaxID=2998417 RepID=A0ABT3P6I4_9ALTE|nr:DUF692 domain-containing protein [Alteromonas aquimaris]MCW8108374.1 DUF692 domain-containing protein [Alteromonas aquimaris]
MTQIRGAGLGLRREMLDQLLPELPTEIDFFEVAPENWIPIGGRFKSQFEHCAAQRPISTHGLSLSIGSPDPLDIELVKSVKHFLDTYEISLYSEHLSYCSLDGHLYDLMPIPFTEEAVTHVAERIRIVQDVLDKPLVLENVSYYLAPENQLTELEFINAVIAESNCQMLLDVNNVYVNSINHKYDPYQFIGALPSAKIVYGHIAGHFDEAEDLKVDTHGAGVIDDVWALLDFAYKTHGVFPTLLERDFNIPPLVDLLAEVGKIKIIQNRYLSKAELSQQTGGV